MWQSRPAVKAQVDAVTDSLSELESQQAGSDAGWQDIQASLTGTEAGYQALVQAVAALSSDTAVLTDEESRGNAVRQLAGGIIKALQGITVNLSGLRRKQVKTALQQATAKSRHRKSTGCTEQNRRTVPEGR